MSNKIFISYNHNDKLLIDTIARRLEFEFGRNNIFYDAWSMQPGDSIIGKMNEGLEEFKIFFFFISPNSLKSNMVSLEWQTALNRCVNDNLKFVGVKIANCDIPAILSDKLYIDLYGEGLDDAVEKMKSIIKSESTYKPLENIQNLQANISIITEKEYKVTIQASLYAENNATFAFACKNNMNMFALSLTGAFSCGSDVLTFSDETTLNARTLTPMHMSVRPGFPLSFIVVAKEPLTSCNIFILKDAKKRRYECIPLKWT
ncbi:MAG: toll/interleukin-1 receptor domain-containing protein [Ruminococcus sp.]